VAVVDRGRVWDGTSAITRAMVLLSDYCTVSHAQPVAVGLSEAADSRAVHGRRPVAVHILAEPGQIHALQKVALCRSECRFHMLGSCSISSPIRPSYQRRGVARQAIGEGSRALSDRSRSVSGVSCPQLPKVKEIEET
jgi:hypothetical protein